MEVRRTLRHHPVADYASTTHDTEMEARYRARHARLGVILSLAALAVVAAYALLGHPHAERSKLLFLSSTSAVATASLWVIGPVMARHRHHAPFFFFWSSTIVAITLFGTILDGGARSPIAALLFIPLLYGGLAYRPRVVLALGAAEVVGYGIVILTDPPGNASHAMVLAGSLSLAVFMAAQSAWNREAQARELHALTIQLEAEATHDMLTACLNRRGFDAAIQAEVSRAIRYGRPMSLLLLDVDHLKTINDENGHAGGDAALLHLATALRRAGRPNDLAARLGGDEFAMLVPETAIAGALELAERTHAALRGPGGRGVTVSIGAATLSRDITTYEELIRAADTALYAAKHAGRDRTATFEDASESIPQHINLN